MHKPAPRMYDAVVIGGGPAGSTAALALAQKGWRIALIEKSRFPRKKVCGEFLSAGSLALLARLGVVDDFTHRAGPEVKRVGLFVRHERISAAMPAVNGNRPIWGRALSREQLDTLLLERACSTGVKIFQPCFMVDLNKTGSNYCCRITSRTSPAPQEVRSPIVIVASGSWDPGGPTGQAARPQAKPSDLFAFKAHFQKGRLENHLMPLIAFPGGYGGMVHCDGDRMSFSCCIRRDHLERCRETSSGRSAAENVFNYIKKWNNPVCDVLDGAILETPWLATGPIRPGIRQTGNDGLFYIGNAAGEAHPAIAEGISMAIRSAFLLCEKLTHDFTLPGSSAALAEATTSYASAWKAQFAWTIRFSALIAHWAMRPAVADASGHLLRWFPAILTYSAKLAGKNAGLLETKKVELILRAN